MKCGLLNKLSQLFTEAQSLHGKLMSMLMMFSLYSMDEWKTCLMTKIKSQRQYLIFSFKITTNVQAIEIFMAVSIQWLIDKFFKG